MKHALVKDALIYKNENFFFLTKNYCTDLNLCILNNGWQFNFLVIYLRWYIRTQATLSQRQTYFCVFYS